MTQESKKIELSPKYDSIRVMLEKGEMSTAELRDYLNDAAWGSTHVIGALYAAWSKTYPDLFLASGMDLIRWKASLARKPSSSSTTVFQLEGVAKWSENNEQREVKIVSTFALHETSDRIYIAQPIDGGEPQKSTTKGGSNATSTRTEPDYSIIDKLVSESPHDSNKEKLRDAIVACAWEPAMFARDLDAYVQTYHRNNWAALNLLPWTAWCDSTWYGDPSDPSPNKRMLRVVVGAGQNAPTLYFALSERNGVVKIERTVSAFIDPNQRPYGADEGTRAVPYSIPRMGLREVKRFDPGMTYGPGPHGWDLSGGHPGAGYRGYPGGGVYGFGFELSTVDVWVSDFSEVQQYLDLIEKKGFSVSKTHNILAEMMDKDAGPNLERRFRFKMSGRWDEVQQVGICLTLEVHDIGWEIPISLYQTFFGQMGVHQPQAGYQPNQTRW